MAVPFNQIEYRGVLYKPFYQMNGDKSFYQSDDGHVYWLNKGVLRCAYSQYAMNANGVFTKGLQECKKKPGVRRPCHHVVTQEMDSLITLWRITKVSLCRLRMFEHIANFHKGTVKRVFDHFKAALYPDLVVDFNILYERHEASIKYLRRQTLKPWNSADTCDQEMRKLMVDVPRYSGLHDEYQLMLGNEMAEHAIVNHNPAVPIEERVEVVEARAAVQEVVNARRQGIVGRIYYETTLASGQVVRKRL